MLSLDHNSRNDDKFLCCSLRALVPTECLCPLRSDYRHIFLPAHAVSAFYLCDYSIIMSDYRSSISDNISHRG